MPEHFNLPWLDAIARVDPDGRAFRWHAQPRGSGALAAALDSGALDAALLLTEGAVAALAGGAAFSIVSDYVQSPLEWGIHVPAASAFDEASIQGARYAISRHGSGSHLMAFAHARAQGWPLGELRFVVVGTLEGAVMAFRDGQADVFFWERVMTQPLVDAGEFRRVGLFTAPWPAFVLCVSDHVATPARDRLEVLFDTVLRTAQAFKNDAERSAARINREFGIEHADALEWLDRTRWAVQRGIDNRTLRAVADVLLDAQLIAAVPEFLR